MIRRHYTLVPARRVTRSGRAVTGPRWTRSNNTFAVYVDDSLRVPLLNRELRNRVRALLHRGERAIVLDLARVSRIDAAGVGELARAYNMASAANGALRIVHVTRWVREILERVGLFELLTGAHRFRRGRTPRGAPSGD